MPIPNPGKLALRLAAEELRRLVKCFVEHPDEFEEPDADHIDDAITACNLASNEASGAVQRLADSREMPAYKADVARLIRRVDDCTRGGE